MRKYRSRIIVLEYKRCDFSPFVLDKYPELNCAKGEQPWRNLFCPAAHASPHFRLLFANSGYAVLSVREKSADGKPGRAASIEDIRAWKPMLDRCLKEEPEACVSRTAELASMFHAKIGQPKVAKALLGWVRQHVHNDGVAHYLLGYHLDYDLGQPKEAAGHYSKAIEHAPNNPLIVREYLMWLDVEAKDNRTLERLMRPRRATRGERSSLLDLRDVTLACEASITALELFRDLDWAEDLWEFATTEGIGSQCVKNNWPLHNGGRDMEKDLGAWGVFLNVFWFRKLRSQLATSAGNAVRYQIPRRPWRLGLAASFERSGDAAAFAL